MSRLAPSVDRGFSLGVHAAVYAMVTILTVLFVERLLMSAIVILTLSGAIEIMQEFVPGVPDRGAMLPRTVPVSAWRSGSWAC